MSYLAKLRGASPSAKRRYSLAISSVVTGLIGVVWLATLPSKLAEEPVVAEADAENPVFSQFMDDIKGQVAAVYKGFVGSIASTSRAVEEELARQESVNMSSTTEVAAVATTTAEQDFGPSEVLASTTLQQFPASTTTAPTPIKIRIATTTSKKSE